MQKDAHDPEQPNAWDVPGGRLRLDEPLDEHISREVFEEVGLRVTPSEPFAMWDWFMRGRGEHAGATVRVVAIARGCTTTATEIYCTGRTDDDFLSEARWVEFSDVLGYPLIPSLLPAIRTFLATSSTAASR